MGKVIFLRFCFLILLLNCLGGAPVYAQREISERLEWFDSFFSPEPAGDTEEIIKRLKGKIELAIHSNDAEREALLRKELGLIQLTRIPVYDSAFANFFRALQIEDSLGLSGEEVITYLAMTKVFEELGEFHKALEMLDQAVELSRPMKDVNILVRLLNVQGRLNTFLGRTETASENYQLVLKFRDSIASRKPEAEALFNLGQLYREKLLFAESLEFHKKALEIFRALDETLWEGKALNEIGEVYAVTKKDEKALANFVVALQIRRKANDPTGLAETYNNIGQLYYRQRNYERAVANLLLGLHEAKAAQSAEQSASAYEYLSFCYKDVGDFRQALEYEEAYTGMMQMMRNERIQHELSDRQSRFEIEKKELKIRELQLVQKERELKIEAQKKTQNFLTVLIGFGIIIISLVLYLYLVKRRANIALGAAHGRVHKQNIELQNLNATKDKFFSIISHDLKGPLNSFTSFSRMLINHTDSLTKEEIQMLAKEIDKNLKNLFTLLENLLEWSRSQTGNIEFKPEIFDLRELIVHNGELLSTQARNKNIELHFSVSDRLPVRAHRHSINTVIRNLTSNAIKFTPPGGIVAIQARERGPVLEVSIKDNGVGMSEDVLSKLFRIDTKYSTNGTSNEKGTGLGLILCKDFVEKNGGEIGVHSAPGKGSTFWFTLPLPPINHATGQSAVKVAYDI